ncbi:MAG: TetR/AcrR family transcriptional regulator [Clostridia bacterium]|nr:TetR/AcrR family transcriptional regulator [Clostridia bacterium]
MRKGEVRRQAIIEAADRLFCRRGYLETTVDDILTELSCSKGSFYHYFDSKLAVLQAICEEKAEAAFEQYKATRVLSTKERLNALLYWMQPFRPEEEDFLCMALRLRRHGEALVMEGATRQALRRLFKPELENVLMVLNETGAARIARPRLDDLLFETTTAFYDEVSEAVLDSARRGGSVARPVTQAVEAARFLWERALDLDYGSVELVRLDEMLPVLERVAQKLRNG